MSFEHLAHRIIAAHGASYDHKVPSAAPGPNGWTQGPVVSVTNVVRGREHLFTSTDIKAGLSEGQAQIILDAATCPMEPKDGHLLSLSGANDWRQITSVDVRRDRGKPVIYVVTVKR